jgi:hypothetical protein
LFTSAAQAPVARERLNKPAPANNANLVIFCVIIIFILLLISVYAQRAKLRMLKD